MISHQPIPTVEASVISPRSATLAAQSTSKWRQKPMNTSLGWRSPKGQLMIGWCLLFTLRHMTVDSWWLDMIGWFKILPFTSPKIHDFMWGKSLFQSGVAWAKKHQHEAKGITFRCRNNHNNAMKIISPAKIWSFKKLSATKTIQSLWFQISF